MASKDIRKVKVLCMTLAKFIVTYGPFEYEGHKALEVSHVFLDEAGYCNCIQTLTLFSLHAPITLLGDHMQLPPVCEIDREQLKNQIDGDESHRYSFLWDMPAMTVDNFFDSTPELLEDSYRDELEPSFRFISKSKISTSYRFGQNLADILGKNVYGFEMVGKAEGPLELIVVDAPPTGFNEKNRNGSFYRYNNPEAEKVREIIKTYKLEDDDYIILTPYRNQIDCLKKKGVDRNRILTIHKSQGKEWDTVILSVCDCSLNPEDMKYRFTSTDPNKLESHGLRPINTAVSRAKKRLIIVCDYKYWSNQQNELIGEIVRTGRVD